MSKLVNSKHTTINKSNESSNGSSKQTARFPTDSKMENDKDEYKENNDKEQDCNIAG